MATPYYIGGTAGGGAGSVPNLTSPYVSQVGALTGSLAALPTAESLATGVNKFNLDELTKQYAAGIPNYRAMLASSSQNILDALQGKVPSDVLSQMIQSGAERGVAMGSPGSPNANAAYLRALGLTSLGLQKQGEEELTAAMGRTPKVPLYDVGKEMLSPKDIMDWQEKRDIYAAAPNPAAAQRAAMDAALKGINTGYTGARSPAGDIAEKYAPKFTPVPGSYGYSEPWTGSQFSPEDVYKPGYSTTYGMDAMQGATYPSTPDTGMSDQDWSYYFGGEGLPAYTGGVTNVDYGQPTAEDLSWLFDPTFTGVQSYQYEPEG